MTAENIDLDNVVSIARMVCGNCGGSAVQVVHSRPSLDDRYAVGYCITCAPRRLLMSKKGRRIPEPRTVALVRSDLFDREALERRRLVEKKRKAGEKLFGKGSGKLSQEQRAEAEAAITWLMTE